MMAAGTAAENGARVVLLERNNRLGVKLLLTGKGRCNITNALAGEREFVQAFGKNGSFIFSALHSFGLHETLEFFHSRGLKTKVERGNRIFPESDSTVDVLKVLTGYLKEQGVTVLTGRRAKEFITEGKMIKKLRLFQGEVAADKYIVATGGLSYPVTGSTGDGMNWAKKLGHKITAPRPALVPLIVREKWVKELEGLSLKNVKISLWQNNKKQDERMGEALFTAQGLSGPIILDLSKTAGAMLAAGPVDLKIDFKPALDYPTLDRRVLSDLQENKTRVFKNILKELLPQKMIPAVIRLSGIKENKKAAEINKEERKVLLKLLKEFKLTVTSLEGYDNAIVTTGGVVLNEVDPKTMRSKIIDNLYFAGEVLDLDGPTGGYNLQVAWSTGYVAGMAASQK